MEGIGGVYEDVESLYISMHNAPGVQMEQCGEQLLGHPPHFLLAVVFALDLASLEQLGRRALTWWRSPLGAYCMRM